MNYIKLFIFLSVFPILSIASCKGFSEDEPHEHTYSKEWFFNETHHWHQSNCEHSLIKDYEEHIFDDGSIIDSTNEKDMIQYSCLICKFKKNVEREKNTKNDITIWSSDTGWIKNDNFIACKTEPIYIYCNRLAYFNGNIDEKRLIFYYTIDGSEPTKDSNILRPLLNSSCASLLIENPCILKVFAVKDEEETSVETYYITAVKEKVPKPIISTENNCKYLGVGETVTITCLLDNASIYYTLDGTEPTTSSIKYSEPFKIYEKCTITAIGIQADYFSSERSIYNADDKSAPSKLVNVSIDHISDTAINVMWENPPELDYEKCLITIDERTIEKDKTITSCIIENLSPYEQKKIKIKTFDTLGNSTSEMSYSFCTFTPSMPTQKGEAIIPEYYYIDPSIIIKKSETEEEWVSLTAWYDHTYVGKCVYTWYQSDDNTNWRELTSNDYYGYFEDDAARIKVLNGVNYYCARIQNTDTIVFTNSCKIDCNTNICENIGKIYYSDGSIDSDYLSGKQVLGIVCNVYPDGSIKNILGLTETADIKFSPSYEISYEKARSIIDGLKNTNELQTAKNYSSINYPAVSFCINNRPNEQWFIPSVQEMAEVLCNHSVINSSLNILTEHNIEVNILFQNGSSFWTSSSWHGYTYWYQIYNSNHGEVFYETICQEIPWNLDILRMLYRVK